MDNKKLNIALAIVIVLLLGLGIFAYIHFSSKKVEKDEYNNPVYEEFPKTVDVKVGEYRFVNISEQDMVISYYKDFINILKNDPNKAWNMINEKNKKNKFNNKYEEFEKYVKSYLISKKMDTYTVKKYKYNYDDIKNTIEFVDTQGILYEIEELSVWNYNISIITKI